MHRDDIDEVFTDGGPAPEVPVVVTDSSEEVAAPGLAAEPSDIERLLADQRDRYLRLAAEYDNYRKRSIKERGEAQARGQADLVKALLEPLDDLTRFAHVQLETTDLNTLFEGVTMVEKKLLKTLGAAGLEVVNPAGTVFNPNLHEAVATEPAAVADEDDHVARVFQHGYLFNGQLLRPARVVVKQWNG